MGAPGQLTDAAGESVHRPVRKRFTAVTAVISAHLPFGLGRLVRPDMVGFAAINLTTFGCDLSVLTATHSGLGWPLPVCITAGYLTGFSLSFVLNRALNFDTHRPVGGQLARYVLVVAVNYLVNLLGIGDGLAAAGLDYRLARLVAGLCEAVFVYSAMRWWVFKEDSSASS